MSLVRRLLLFTFSHRTLALLRWDLYFLSTRFKNFALARHRQLLKRLAASPRPLYINLGSGPRGVAGEHWLNIDGYPGMNVHYLMDLTRRWPFPDESVDGIFCEHVFEHFDFEQGKALLQESQRVLHAGGSLRLIVPDGAKILATYCTNPTELLTHRETETRSPMEAVNSYFRQRYEHQFIYDWPLLKYQLELAGFANVTQVSCAEGNSSRAIILDDEKYAWESLYVEAVKPTRHE